jgi:transposase
MLLDQVVGLIVAAQVVASWSHRCRLRSEAAFVTLGGVAPIEASSGTVLRHLLNRSGSPTAPQMLSGADAVLSLSWGPK